MSSVKCQVCKAVMLQPLNLFGVRDLVHPDTPCIPQVEKRRPAKWVVVRCPGCRKDFAHRADKPRVTCSRKCARLTAKLNLLKGRESYWGHIPRKTRNEHLRTHWQKRAQELDQRWEKSA